MRTIPALLAEIPDLAAQVWVTRDAPNPAPRADRHIRPVPGSRPPANLDVIDLLRTDPLDDLTIGSGAATSHLVDRLGMCVRMVAEERAEAGLGQPEPRYGDFSGTCQYLASTAGWWQAERGLSEDVGHEIEQVHKALERAARVPHEPRYRCNQCGAIAHPQPGGRWMLCESGHELDGLGAIRDKLRRSKPMTAHAMEREWGESLGIRADTISAWSRRGWLTETGRVLIDRRWRPVFHPWDVMAVLQRHAGGGLAESG